MFRKIPGLNTAKKLSNLFSTSVSYAPIASSARLFTSSVSSNTVHPAYKVASKFTELQHADFSLGNLKRASSVVLPYDEDFENTRARWKNRIHSMEKNVERLGKEFKALEQEYPEFKYKR